MPILSYHLFNLSTNLRHSQNTITHKVDLSLPQIALSMNRIYPAQFFEKSDAIKNKWYDKIGISYAGDFQNNISMRDTNILNKRSNLFDSLHYGMRHNIPISASYSNRFFSFSPQANFTSLWYFDKVIKSDRKSTRLNSSHIPLSR